MPECLHVELPHLAAVRLAVVACFLPAHLGSKCSLIFFFATADLSALAVSSPYLKPRNLATERSLLWEQAHIRDPGIASAGAQAADGVSGWPTRWRVRMHGSALLLSPLLPGLPIDAECRSPAKTGGAVRVQCPGRFSESDGKSLRLPS